MSASPERSSSCPLCHGASRYAFEKGGIGIHDCLDCRHRFANLQLATNHTQSVYDNSYFDGGGAGYADYLSDRPLRESQARRYARILRHHSAPGYMLDVGAAAGFILNGFFQEGWQGEGVEPNPDMADYADREMGIQIHATALEDFQPHRQYDLVTMIQVLPHLTDVLGCLEKVSAILRPHGLCLVESWDRGSLTAKLFGQAWHEYSPPSVLHWFDCDGMDQVMNRFGMNRIAAGHSIKWISAAHGKSLVQHKLASNVVGRIASHSLALIPDRLNLPYPGNDLVWLLYRKASD